MVKTQQVAERRHSSPLVSEGTQSVLPLLEVPTAFILKACEAFYLLPLRPPLAFLFLPRTRYHYPRLELHPIGS